MFKLFLKKFVLILFGIFLSLIFLECGLRIVSFTLSSYQQYKNNKVLKNKSQYTIMCLGESTTIRQYPVQLQQILNEKYPDKFSVIDCGIPGANLEIILDALDRNINKYKPNIAICMMGGIGVYSYNTNTKSVKNKVNLKFYKLFVIGIKYLLNKDYLLFATDIDVDKSDYMKQFLYFRSHNQYKEAENVLKKEILINPNNEFAKANLACLYCFFTRNNDTGFKMAIEAINRDISDYQSKSMYYNIILVNLKENKDTKTLAFYADKIVSKDIEIFKYFNKIENYHIIKDFISVTDRDKILSVISKNVSKDIAYSFYAMNYMEQQNYQKAKLYFDKAEELRLNYPNMEMYNLYKLIVKKLTDNNIKVICMQYPVRSVKPLQEQLKDEPYYDKITFISNEKLFKDALMKKDCNEIFRDLDCGDFGHCTSLGNTMIAENVVSTLEDILDLK